MLGQLRGPLLRKFLEIVFDGKPEADETIRVAAANRRAASAKARELLTLPIPVDALQRLASRYTSPKLGAITVTRKDAKAYLRTVNWSSELALRKNEDGTHSYITIDPGLEGIEFVRDDNAATPTLILRDAQHEYRFVKRRVLRRGHGRGYP